MAALPAGDTRNRWTAAWPCAFRRVGLPRNARWSRVAASDSRAASISSWISRGSRGTATACQTARPPARSGDPGHPAGRPALDSAATLDQLVFRSNPSRLKAKGRDAVQAFLKTPAGQATVAAVGLLVTVVVVQKIRHRND